MSRLIPQNTLRLPVRIVIVATALLLPVLAQAQGRARTTSRGGNTLQICHVMGHGAARLMNVDLLAEADHLGHGDWYPAEYFQDADGDGFGGRASVLACSLPEGYSENDLDCDDQDPTSHPGAIELVDDNRDNDCDGWVDEGWPSWGDAATRAARQAALTWMSGASVRSDSCTVNAPLAVAGALSVTGPSVSGRIEQALLDAGASSDVAAGWDAAFTQAWHGWSGAMTIPALPWYPLLVSWPGAYAAPHPNLPMPLSAMLSTGRPGMRASSLRSGVTSGIGARSGEPGAGAAIEAFATEIAARFDTSLLIPVTNVMGEGPVPSYHPLFMPVGPVLGGKCWGGDFPTQPWQ